MGREVPIKFLNSVKIAVFWRFFFLFLPFSVQFRPVSSSSLSYASLSLLTSIPLLASLSFPFLYFLTHLSPFLPSSFVPFPPLRFPFSLPTPPLSLIYLPLGLISFPPLHLPSLYPARCRLKFEKRIWQSCRLRKAFEYYHRLRFRVNRRAVYVVYY